MEQVLFHMPVREATMVTFDEARAMIRQVAYTLLIASWTGASRDKAGVYFVLMGEPQAVDRAIERLAEKLFFATRLQTLK